MCFHFLCATWVESALVVACLLAQPTSLLSAETNTVTIALDRRAGKTERIEVQGLSPDQLRELQSTARGSGGWTALLTLRVGASRDAVAQPMLGEYSVAEGKLQFEPRFPLRAGLTYTATFRPPEGAGSLKQKLPPIVQEFKIPAGPLAAPTVVEQVYPTRNVLPENQLKLYLHFSAPMSQGDSYQHIHLLDASGQEIDLPFLELGEELWNETGTRLTLFFDPGRIKRGVKPREDLGPVLEEGHSYTLVIVGTWRDAAGQPLSAPFRKSFKVGPADDVQPDVKRWTVVPPAAGSRDAFVVQFDEPLDHALLQRLLSVRNADGKPVPGRIKVDREETRWLLYPDQAWPAGAFRLTAETTLEDLAGNSLGRPFETDIFRRIESSVSREMTAVPFDVRPGLQGKSP